MSKVHLNRIRKRYGWTGKKYEELMRMIIAENTLSVANAMSRLTHGHFQKELNKLSGDRKKIINLPDITEVLPKRSVFIRKGADHGKLITDALRDNLAKDFRDVLAKPEYLTARGKYTSRLKRRVVADFEDTIKKTFANYTRKDPALGVPANVHAIAVTEIRSVVDQTKAEFMNRFRQKNPDVTMTKTWIHNTSLSKNRKYIRKHHLALNGVEILIDKNFVAHDHKSGMTFSIPYPHHESLPPGEVITCHCEVVYRIQKKVDKK